MGQQGFSKLSTYSFQISSFPYSLGDQEGKNQFEFEALAILTSI